MTTPKPTPRLLAAACALTLGFTAPGSAQERADLRLVEIGAAPQDEVTTRLKDALVDAIKISDVLTLSTGQKPGTLVISFPKPVEAREHMGRIEYLFRVDYRAINGRLFERGFGNCWADELRRCVFGVVRTANRIAPRQ